MLKKYNNSIIKTNKINPYIKPISGLMLALVFPIVMILIDSYVDGTTSIVMVNGVLGLFMGYVMQRSFFGFSGASIKTAKGNPTLTYAILVMFGVTSILVATIAAAGEANFIKAITHGAKAIGLGTILGALIFGFGMVLAGTSASGSLVNLSNGGIKTGIILVFILLGAGPGQLTQGVMLDNLGTGGNIYSLPSYLGNTTNVPPGSESLNAWGLFAAVLLTLCFLLTIGVIACLVSRKIRNKNNWNQKDLAKKMNETPDNYYRWLIKNGFKHENDGTITPDATTFRYFYFKLFGSKLSYWAGTIIFGFFLLICLLINGRGWGVSLSFVRIFDWTFNIDPSIDCLDGQIVGGVSILNDEITWRNIGLVVGGFVFMLSSGRFQLISDWSNFKNYNTYVGYGIAALGGLFLGFGARMADGANAGQLATGIITFSLSSWVFAIFTTSGVALAICIPYFRKKYYRNI